MIPLLDRPKQGRGEVQGVRHSEGVRRCTYPDFEYPAPPSLHPVVKVLGKNPTNSLGHPDFTSSAGLVDRAPYLSLRWWSLCPYSGSVIFSSPCLATFGCVLPCASSLIWLNAGDQSRLISMTYSVGKVPAPVYSVYQKWANIVKGKVHKVYLGKLHYQGWNAPGWNVDLGQRGVYNHVCFLGVNLPFAYQKIQPAVFDFHQWPIPWLKEACVHTGVLGLQLFHLKVCHGGYPFGGGGALFPATRPDLPGHPQKLRLFSLNGANLGLPTAGRRHSGRHGTGGHRCCPSRLGSRRTPPAHRLIR